MTILEQYLNELFGFSKHRKSKYTDPDGKPELFGVSVQYTSPQEKGEEICEELEDKNQEEMEDEEKRKCGRLPDDSKEKKICVVKNRIYYLNELVYDLVKNKSKCGNMHTICWDVINKKVYEIKKEIKEETKNLHDLEKSKK